MGKRQHFLCTINCILTNFFLNLKLNVDPLGSRETALSCIFRLYCNLFLFLKKLVVNQKMTLSKIQLGSVKIAVI